MHPNLLEQLMIFEKAVNLGGFSAAARDLNRTVSAIGYSIAQLEDQLGLQLFDRSGYRPRLTPQGQALCRDTHIIMRRIERFEARVKALRDKANTQITIAASPLFPAVPLSQAMADFAREHPEMQLSILQIHAEEGLTKLEEGQVDLVLGELYGSHSLQGMDGSQIAASEMNLVVAPNHPLAKINAPFALSELDDHTQIILSPYSVDSIPYDISVHVTDIISVNNTELMKNLIVSGAGWGYMTKHAIEKELQSGALIPLECKDIVDKPIVRFVAAWPTKNPPSETLHQFFDLLTHYCRPTIG